MVDEQWKCGWYDRGTKFHLFLNIIKVAHAAVGSCDGLCGFKGLTKEY